MEKHWKNITVQRCHALWEVNQLEHGNSKHSGRRQVCLTQIQAMVKQTCWISSTHQGITNTCTHPCMPIKGVICNAVQCNARVFMAMVVVVVARHEQTSSQACELVWPRHKCWEWEEGANATPPVNHGTKEWRKVDGYTSVQVNADHTLHLLMWWHTCSCFTFSFSFSPDGWCMIRCLVQSQVTSLLES